MTTIDVYVAGRCSGNPGPSSIGWLIFQDIKELAKGALKLKGNYTNNVAIYEAIVNGLLEAQPYFEDGLILKVNSKVHVDQLTGRCCANGDLLAEYLERVKYFAGEMSGEIEYEEVPKDNRNIIRVKNLAGRHLGMKIIKPPKIKKIVEEPEWDGNW